MLPGYGILKETKKYKEITSVGMIVGRGNFEEVAEFEQEAL